MANITFGERMRRARVKSALTQAEVGEKLDVTGATIGNWEKGKTSPDRDQKAKLRAVLGMDSPQPGHPDKPARARGTPEPGGEGPSALSTWLNRTRLSKKLTVAELAQKSGLSGPAIYNIESGRIANPRVETTRRLEKALGIAVPAETKNEVREEAEIEGFGELQDFDPHDDDRPSVSGVYVLYDVAERPIYVGEGANIKRRIRDHHEKFWFKSPIVETAAYVKIDEERLRRKVEAVLIRFLKSNAVINKKNVDR
jgi:transcriptional regulator with XRE-family HTH domain